MVRWILAKPFWIYLTFIFNFILETFVNFNFFHLFNFWKQTILILFNICKISEKKAQQKKLEEVEKTLKKQNLSELEIKKAQMTKEDLLKQEEDYRKKEEKLQHKDKLTPWNVDTICKEGFSKSLINK